MMHTVYVELTSAALSRDIEPHLYVVQKPSPPNLYCSHSKWTKPSAYGPRLVQRHSGLRDTLL